DGLNSKYDTVKFLVKEAETFTVEAGSNKDVLHEEKVELKGSISGLHKDSMTHIWSCGSLTLTTPTELEASFIVPSIASGNITCTLTVKDGLNSKYDTVKFLVKEAETFTVEAGSNKDVLHEEKVELKGSISGLHKDSMTHIWSCGSLTLTTPTELEASFIVPSAASGNITCTLTVKDGLNSRYDTVKFTVKEPSFSIDAGHDKEVIRGEEVSLNGTITGTYGSGTTYSWSCGSLTLLNPTNLTSSFTVPLIAAGNITCTLTVKDGLNSRYDTVKFTVKEPSFIIDAGRDKEVVRGEIVELKGSISGSHGDLTTYSWSCGSLTLTTPTELEASFIVPSIASGNITCTLIVKDGLNPKYDTVKFTLKKEIDIIKEEVKNVEKITSVVNENIKEIVIETPIAEKVNNEVVQEEVFPEECIKVGLNSKSDCDLYVNRFKIIAECKSNNLNTKESCREYILSKYGKLSRCVGVNTEACNNLIDNIFLSSIIPPEKKMTDEIKKQLDDVSGSSAIIDTKASTITVQVKSVVPDEKPQPKEIKVAEIPLASSNESISVSLLPTSGGSSGGNSSPVVIVFDSDGDGLPDDIERRKGTDLFSKDTDGDGVDDNQELKNGTNPLDAVNQKGIVILAGVDKAIVEGKTLEQPEAKVSPISVSLTVDSIKAVKVEEKNSVSFQGKAEPNQIVTLFIYSTMPIVITVQADANGNWTYDLDKTLVDGTHEVYVAVNNDEGKLIEASLPTTFLVAEAQAFSVDEYLAMNGSAKVPDKVNNMMTTYVLGGLGIVLILIAGILIIRNRSSE
ncbi:MAG: Ig-like domain-containing protein, partial [Candidatus Paceibacterota bacterium]